MLGWELPPYNSGGLGVACYQLCKALAARGADIEFVLPYRHDQPVEFMTVTTALPQTATALWSSGGAYDSLEYTAVRHSTRLTVADQQRRYAAAVEKLVEERSFDVIHAHDWLTFRAALAAKARTGWPLIVHVHSLECDRAGQEHGGNPLVREIEAAGMLLADRIIAVSERTKAAMVREYGIPADKIEVIHNSLDAAELTPLDPANAYHYLASMKSHGYQVVASIGRLTIQKGLTNLLRAAADVIARVPQTLFLIVGSGEQYAELIELAAELGIARTSSLLIFSAVRSYAMLMPLPGSLCCRLFPSRLGSRRWRRAFTVRRRSSATKPASARFFGIV